MKLQRFGLSTVIQISGVLIIVATFRFLTVQILNDKVMDLMSGGKMSGRVQLDAWHGTLLNCYGNFFLTILSFDDSDVGVDQRVVLLFEIK
eukprot:CAMPEP_0170476546 /NCGR_PEP_ID=MMETSP0123-20130129/17921_1 /TAXON_ID=182087 /ORGANISM="Favella ehrenbergii, Strain Fehren 1" /LENGTH=90 /DNA_ID=CAMNT_0010747613 /DNA_START=374 /DNA_END=643 /DNA_ORIENTATION=+